MHSLLLMKTIVSKLTDLATNMGFLVLSLSNNVIWSIMSNCESEKMYGTKLCQPCLNSYVTITEICRDECIIALYLLSHDL